MGPDVSSVAQRWLTANVVRQARQGFETELWKQFWDEQYDGGKKRVRNPDSKTRKKYPEIAASTALKKSPFRERVFDQYYRWKKTHLKKRAPTGMYGGVSVSFPSEFGPDSVLRFEKIAKKFGVTPKQLTAHLVRLSGASGIQASGYEDIKMSVEAARAQEGDADILVCIVKGGPIEIMSRVINLQQKRVYNDYLFLKEKAPPGIGTRILAHQVREGRRMGLHAIDCFAGGEGPEGLWDEHDKTIGYYVWPLLGYDTQLSKDDFKHIERAKISLEGEKEYFEEKIKKPSKKTLAELKELGDLIMVLNKLELQLQVLFKGKKSISIQELMKTPEGRSFWKYFGTGKSMSFSLKDGSVSLEVMRRYLRKKNISMKIAAESKGISIEMALLEDVDILAQIWDELSNPVVGS